ncbi:hypothetical protein CEUSTIGMA_g2397.t1 [Chlamydomonas eustigma]|uniref:Uncharacterized protein n=1 Tax=Chlamydomonas eustigma TaxID=1157962 RepID=A0A250WVV5_9CHLO|nr:hypothetical protein CEUSTIGMA_g2397.t1 [Chlamydomonas eustigma]|eukprot:GAX74951.1 hypothetical protein CEUSTIGMA_g2397.t1 [Chlamydomonas eustigma]
MMTQHPPFLPLHVLDVAMAGSRLQGWPELLKRSQLSRNDDEPRGELGCVPGMQAVTTSPHPHLSPSTGTANSSYLHVFEREEVGGMGSSAAHIDADWPPSTPSGQADISDITANCIPLFYYLEQEKPPSNRDNGGRAEHIAAGISQQQQQHNALPCKEGSADDDEGSLGLLGHGPGAMKSSTIMSQPGVPALHTGLGLMAAGASHAAGSTALLVSSGSSSSSSNISIWRKHAVPTQILQKHWKVFDIVTAASTHTNCITKHYSHLSLGAGSVLASTSFAKQYCTTDSRGRMHIPTNPLQGLQTTSGALLHADSSEPSSCRAPGNHAWKRVQGGVAIPTSGDEDCSSSVESSDRELGPAGHEVPNRASSSTNKCLPKEATGEPWNEHEMEWNQDDSIIARPRGACDNDLLM